jgi:hypothetical protein
MVEASETIILPLNTIVVRPTGDYECELGPCGEVENSFQYDVVALNIEEGKQTFTYDACCPFGVPPGVALTSTERVGEMRVVGDSELELLRRRGVSVIIETD